VRFAKTDIDILKEVKETQHFLCQALGLDNEYDLVFFHPFFEYGVPHSKVINLYLAEGLKKLEITPIITSKGARHTFGSVLLAKGYSMDVVSKLMGHKDMSMLIRVYGHSLDENVAKQIESIKKLFD